MKTLNTISGGMRYFTLPNGKLYNFTFFDTGAGHRRIEGFYEGKYKGWMNGINEKDCIRKIKQTIKDYKFTILPYLEE